MNSKTYRQKLVAGIFTAEQLAAAAIAGKQLKQSLFEHSKELWANGMNLLLSIHREEKKKLAAIWDAPDADEFAEKIKTPISTKANTKLIDATIAELSAETVPLAEKVSSVIADNAKAKAELKALSKKI